MGVPEFWKTFIFDQIPKDKWKIDRIYNAYSMLWDFNAVLYNIANDIYGLGDKLNGTTFEQRNIDEINKIKELFHSSPDILEQQFLQKIGEILELNIFSVVMPSDILIIAIDGIPPFAKAKQQRIRRFGSALDRIKKESVFGNKYNNEEYTFDTLNFTVGTPIMKRICEYIHTWISINRKRLPHYVKFSDCSEEGEGEHKMFHFFEGIKERVIFDNSSFEGKYTPEQAFKLKSHIVVGPDSDLCFLSLIRNEYSFYWLRNTNIGYERNKIPFDVININEIRNFVVTTMGGNTNNLEQSKKYLIDFNLMSFFIGDDFVPPMFAFNLDPGLVLVDMMNKYAETFSGSHLVVNGKINLFSFSNFILELVSIEKYYYELKQEAQNIEMEYSSRLENNQETTLILEERTQLRNFLKRNNNMVFEPSLILHENDYESFVNQWKNFIICPSIMLNNEISPLMEDLINTALSKVDEEIEIVCKSFLYGLQWNISYYLGYDVNNWNYEWSLPPTIFQLNQFIQNNDNFTIPSMIKHTFEPKVNLTQLLFSIMNTRLSIKFFRTSFKGVFAIKKNTLTAIPENVTRQVPFFDAYEPVNFNKFFEGQYYNSNHGKHNSIILVPRIPLNITLKLNEISKINTNGFPGGRSTPENYNINIDELIKTTLYQSMNDATSIEIIKSNKKSVKFSNNVEGPSKMESSGSTEGPSKMEGSGGKKLDKQKTRESKDKQKYKKQDNDIVRTTISASSILIGTKREIQKRQNELFI